MENKIALKMETMQKLQFLKNSLETIEISQPNDNRIWRELIDCLDEIADDLQIDLPSAFDLGNEENYGRSDNIV